MQYLLRCLTPALSALLVLSKASTCKRTHKVETPLRTSKKRRISFYDDTHTHKHTHCFLCCVSFLTFYPLPFCLFAALPLRCYGLGRVHASACIRSTLLLTLSM